GCPFPETRYLAPVHVIEVSADGPEDDSCLVPQACADRTLRDRVDWWTAHGSRVFLALGDDVTDFGGTRDPDKTGAEKTKQIFWDPRLGPGERNSHQARVRDALEAAGLAIGPVATSPRGDRYAQVRPVRAGTTGVEPAPLRFTASELRAALSG